MTLAAVRPRLIWEGNGATDSISLSVDGEPIVFRQNSHIKVKQLVVATGVTSDMVEDVDYTLTGSPDEGVVTRIAGDLPSGYRWAIYRDQPYAQDVELGHSGDFSSSDIAKMADVSREIDQELGEKTDRTVKMSMFTSTSISTEMPAPSPFKVLGWNSSGDALVNFGVADLNLSVVTEFAHDFLAASSPEEARGLLEVPTSALGKSLISAETAEDARDLIELPASALGQSLITAETAEDARALLEIPDAGSGSPTTNIYVVDFADGPLEKDDDITEVVQAAVDSIPTGFNVPHTLVFPDGQYFISDEIDLGTRGRLTLKCEGAGSCVLILEAGANSNMFRSGDGVTYTPSVTFENLYLTGNRTEQTGGNAIIFFDAVEFPTVRNCIINEAYADNIRFEADSISPPCNFPRILNCVLQSPGGNNIVLGQNAYGALIVGNHIRGAGKRETTSGAGIYGDNTSEHTITGNMFDENVIHIRLNSCERCTVSGNQGLNSERDGFVLQSDCKHISVTGNVLTQTGISAPSTFVGIGVSGQYNIVSSNVVAGGSSSGPNNLAYGILEISGSSDNVIEANAVSDADA